MTAPFEIVSEPREKGLRPGLRLQILLALAGVILVAYVPLFFAIAQVTRATSLAYREEAATMLAREIARHAADVARLDTASVGKSIGVVASDRNVVAVLVRDVHGNRLASTGSEADVAALEAKNTRADGHSRTLTHAGARGLDVTSALEPVIVSVRLRTDEDSARTTDVVKSVALYMGVFAFALLVFAYIALTRAIVRPIEQLGRAADRVASGSRSLEVPRSAAREISELGASVRSMAARLLAEEKALRTKVEELTSTTKRLSETREQLAGSERLASVGKLAAGVAHEIGNPIAAIMGMHDLLDDDSIPEATRSDFLVRMRKETERIHVVVRDLLDYARPEIGPASGVIVTNVAAVVDDTLSLVRPQKDWKRVDVTVDVDPTVRVPVSPQRLTQVLLNLLLNAAAAMASMPAGQARTIAVGARRMESGSIQIDVRDNGPGVPQSLRERIFDPFVTTKDVGAGTGLGLSVCRGIVEAVGGRIFVDPDYTGGARFVVELAEAAPSSSHPPS